MNWYNILKVSPYERAVAREFASEDMKVPAKCKQCGRDMFVPSNPNQYQKCKNNDCPASWEAKVRKPRYKKTSSDSSWDEEEGP